MNCAEISGLFAMSRDVTGQNNCTRIRVAGSEVVKEFRAQIRDGFGVEHEKIWLRGNDDDGAPTLAPAHGIIVKAKPDLFVLDAEAVPDLGPEFLYDLRTSHPNARAIVLTGHVAAHREKAANLGAIHFLEKPFPHGDFVDLVQALLSPAGTEAGEKFQGTLSDLHLADIIQLKCMSGSSAVLQFTGPKGEKARVYFDGGQVRHATAPGKEGVPAFNEIVNWKGGQISEVSGAGPAPRTIP